ncbi:hypothetical protein [Marinilabilia rubra]|nr:hypothetical protein [Marinilabilia rubra]
MKSSLLISFSLLFFIGCNSPQSSNNNKNNNCSESGNATEISSQSGQSVSNSNQEDNYTIVWIERAFEPEYNYSVYLQSYKNNVSVGEKTKIDLSSYEGDIMHDKYHVGGSVGFPVQLNSDKTKAYCSIVKNDELEGEFSWAKLVEVQISNQESRVIAEFDGFFPAWHYHEPNNTIYGYLPDKKQLVAINAGSGVITTIKEFQHYQDEFIYYPLNNGSINIITESSEKKVFKHQLSTNNNSIKSTLVANTDQFSSYKNGFMIETYKDWSSEVEELRIYSGGEVKESVPFNFNNFNTYWVSNNEFACIKEDTLVKINTDLKETAEFNKKNIHIIDELENSLFISYGDHGSKTSALLSDDFQRIKVIKDINPDDIIALLK